MEHVKHPSPSVKPASQLLFKDGKIERLIKIVCSNLILPLITQLLNPLIKLFNFIFLVGNTMLPLKRLIIIYISFLLCVVYLLVLIDCEITLPKAKVYCI